MAQSKQSEEEIIKLGKTLIAELDLEYSVNTLARWIAHYISELIVSVENCASIVEKRKLQKECCDLILELWDKKDRLPINKPLDNLKEFLEILSVLQSEKKTNSILPRWIEYRSFKGNTPWSSFVDKIKNNSEKIFYHSIEANINKDLLSKDNDWLHKHQEFLSDDEKELIRHLNSIAKIDFSSGVIDLNKPDEIEVTREERLKYIFKEIEKLIDEQKIELQILKENIFKSIKDVKE